MEHILLGQCHVPDTNALGVSERVVLLLGQVFHAQPSIAVLFLCLGSQLIQDIDGDSRELLLSAFALDQFTGRLANVFLQVRTRSVLLFGRLPPVAQP